MSAPTIRIGLIEVQSRLRRTDSDVVEAYRDSMSEKGQFQPILLERKSPQDGPGYILVDGAHRLEAAKLLGWTAISAEVRAPSSASERRLIEIDANLVRKDLSVLERSSFLGARKVVHEELYPETKAGVAGAEARHGRASGIIPFAESAAEKFGCSRSTVEKLVMIDQRLSDAARDAIQNTPAGQKLTELIALARLEPELQEKVAARLAAEDAAEKTVSQARAAVEGAAKPTPKESGQTKLMELWGRAGAADRRAFLEFLAEQELPAGWVIAHEGEL